MLSAHDVARELRRHLPQAGDLKIHKLLYYCQGWHVAWTGEPMFSDPIEAWTNGPVVADLWHDEKRSRPQPELQRPVDEHQAVIDYVISRYGANTGVELIRITHAEDPWRTVSESEESFTTASPEISLDALRSWFSRDEEFLDHSAAVAGLRKQRHIYGFDGPAMPESLHEATLRVLSSGGESHRRDR